MGENSWLISDLGDLAPYQLAALLKTRNPNWEFGPAYETLGVFGTYEDPRAAVEATITGTPLLEPPKLHKIPVCYELGPDLERCCNELGLSTADLVQQHSATEYTVYALGFQPGFPYMGYLTSSLSGLPRLQSPRPRVDPGMVGIALDQTGIYPCECPGGWNLIGRTPLLICNESAEFFPIAAGDKIRFIPISHAQCQELEGKRLEYA